MGYEWDEAKKQINYEKHGLSFEDAALVFEGATITGRDDRKDYGEARWITYGTIDGRMVVIAHTKRSENVRIISMRKANEREEKRYKKRLKTIGCHE